jgi:outer membrane immunogenic protein
MFAALVLQGGDWCMNRRDLLVFAALGIANNAICANGFLLKSQTRHLMYCGRHQMKALYLLVTACVASAGAASAADLSLLPAAPPVVAPWTGFYIGGNAGVVSQNTTVQDLNNWNDSGSFSIASKNLGATAGIHAGYNIQDGEFVYGIEGDWSWTGTKSDKFLTDSCTCGDPVLTQIHTEMDWVATVRGRAGITFGRTLAYVTGGIAFAQFNNHWGAGLPDPVGGCGGPLACGPINNNNFVSRGIQPGWAVGVGVEHMFAAYPHLTSVRKRCGWISPTATPATPGPASPAGRPGRSPANSRNRLRWAASG